MNECKSRDSVAGRDWACTSDPWRFPYPARFQFCQFSPFQTHEFHSFSKDPLGFYSLERLGVSHTTTQWIWAGQWTILYNHSWTAIGETLRVGIITTLSNTTWWANSSLKGPCSSSETFGTNSKEASVLLPPSRMSWVWFRTIFFRGSFSRWVSADSRSHARHSYRLIRYRKSLELSAPQFLPEFPEEITELTTRPHSRFSVLNLMSPIFVGKRYQCNQKPETREGARVLSRTHHSRILLLYLRT